MDLVSKLETEWSKNFPGDPFPSNITKEKTYDNQSLQNIIETCERTIEDLNKKLKQEIFLRDFLQDFTEKSSHSTESKNKTEGPPNPDFTTSRPTSKSTIGSLITETVSISTAVLNDEGKTEKSTTNPKIQIGQDENSDRDDKLPCIEHIVKSKEGKLSDKIGENAPALRGNIDENLTTGLNNQDHPPNGTFRNRVASFDGSTLNTLNPLPNRQKCMSLSSNSLYTNQKQKNTALKPAVSMKKPPPSLPPKPKKRQSLGITSSCVLPDTKPINNINYRPCSDNIKTNAPSSANANLNPADDPQTEIGVQLPSDCFCGKNELGKYSGYCAIHDVKAGLVKSGTKAVKSSEKQVAVVGGSQSVLRQQQRGLTTITADSDPDPTTTVGLVATEEKLVTTNIAVRATTGNSDDYITKQIINSDVSSDYSFNDETSQTTVNEDKDLHPKVTCLLSAEKSVTPGERKNSPDVAGGTDYKKDPKPPVPTKKSFKSNSNSFSGNSKLVNKQNSPPDLQHTKTDENRKGEYTQRKNEEEKESIENTREVLVDAEEDVNNNHDNVLLRNPNETPQIPEEGSTGARPPHDTTDDTDGGNMSAYKKQREDICFVSYRKLDTEFYESSFTNNATLPIRPERRSSLLKVDKDNDTTIPENLLPQGIKDSVFVQKSNNESSSSLGRNSTFKPFGNKDGTKKSENLGGSPKSDVSVSSSVDTSSGFSSDTPSSSLTTESDNCSVLKEDRPPPSDGEKSVDFTEKTGQDADPKVPEKCLIEVKRNDSGEYKTCIELTDDDESDSSEKKTLKNVNSNSEDDTDEENLSSIYENEQFDSLEDIPLLKMRKQAVRQFLATEEIFVDNLENIKKLMDQFSATIDSKDSLLSKADFEVIFFKISEILALHQTCVKQLTPKVQNWQNNETVGIVLKELMIHFPTFEEYSRNYPFAVEAINRCSQVNGIFKRIAEEANVKADKQKSSLTVLLYKPINQLQFNTSFIKELLRYTPKNHPDHEIIENTWRLTQHNLICITSKSDEDKVENDQYLLKSDYLVELVGNVRKLRCFFLFNDVLVCTKQKFWQKGSFDVKWFIPMSHLNLDKNPDNEEMKYHSTETVDEIKKKISFLETELRKDNEKDKLSDRAKEKLKKKLSDLQRELARLSGYLEFILKHNKKTYTLLMSTDYAREEWKEAICGLKDKCVPDAQFTASGVQQLISNCKKLPSISNLSPHQQTDKIEETGFVGSLIVTLHELTGLDEVCTTYCCLELDSCGQFFTKARTEACNEAHPVWNEEFELELDYSHTLRILCYKKGRDNQGDVLLGKSALALSKDWLSNFTRKTISMNKISLVISINHLPPNKTIQRIPSKVKTGTFGVSISKVAHHQNRPFPAIISICTAEIEKRGLEEVGIYRVSGGQSDVKRLKQFFEKNAIRARKMIADPDFNIHAVAAVLKLYFRELPEPLFTNTLHNKFLAVNDMYDPEEKKKKVITLIHSLPDANYHTLIHLLHHLQRISENSAINKMTNSNLAVIFGQSLMQPAPSSDPTSMEMASFLNAHLQNDVLDYIFSLQCSGVHLARL